VDKERSKEGKKTRFLERRRVRSGVLNERLREGAGRPLDVQGRGRRQPALPGDIRRWGAGSANVAIVRIVIMVGVLAVGVTVTDRYPVVGSVGTRKAASRVVVLEPETWAKKPLTLLKDIDVGDRLAKGRWTVVLFQHGCASCREELPRIEEAAKGRKRTEGGIPVAMVEVPPYRCAARPETESWLYGRLGEQCEWLVETPVVIELAEGIVLRADVHATDELLAGSDRSDSGQTSTMVLTTTETVGGAERRPRQASTRVLGAPVVAAGNEYDFGYVPPGSRHVVFFEIANRSDRTLRILRTRSECRCMAAVSPLKKIQAGQTARLQVVFVASDEPMYYSKRIVLQTTDRQRRTIVLRVKADVGLPLRLEPAAIDAGVLSAGEEKVVNVSVANRSAREILLAYSTSSRTSCFARVPREPVPAAGSLSVPVQITAERASGEDEKLVVRIHTNHEHQRQIALPVTFRVQAANGESSGGRKAGKDGG